MQITASRFDAVPYTHNAEQVARSIESRRTPVPEYFYPGVYVVEVDSSMKSIEGVSTSTADLIGGDCIDRLRHLAGPLPGDWTRHDAQDPGIAVLELLAYVAELLVERADLIGDEAMLHSSRLAAASLALSRDREIPRGSAVKAVTFYEGQLLREESREQNDLCHRLHIGKVETGSE
jgi:hypothetical protein